MAGIGRQESCLHHCDFQPCKATGINNLLGGVDPSESRGFWEDGLLESKEGVTEVRKEVLLALSRVTDKKTWGREEARPATASSRCDWACTFTGQAGARGGIWNSRLPACVLLCGWRSGRDDVDTGL